MALEICIHVFATGRISHGCFANLEKSRCCNSGMIDSPNESIIRFGFESNYWDACIGTPLRSQFRFQRLRFESDSGDACIGRRYVLSFESNGCIRRAALGVASERSLWLWERLRKASGQNLIF